MLASSLDYCRAGWFSEVQYGTQRGMIYLLNPRPSGHVTRERISLAQSESRGFDQPVIL